VLQAGRMLPEPDAEAVATARGWTRLLAGFPALRHRNFRLFVVGQGISLIGFWMQSVAQGWLVFRLSHSPWALGVVASAGYLPILCFAPLMGVVADRLPRRRVLVFTQSILLALALGLAVLVWSDRVSVPIVVAFAFGVGLVSALDVPARQAFLVEMTNADDLPNAIALNSSIFNGARVVGPAIAGGLVSAVGEAPCFFLNALSYVAVVAALVRMRLPRTTGAVPHAPLRHGFLEGVRYVAGVPALRNLLVLLGVVCALGVQYQMLMPVFAKRVFQSDAGSLGLLLAMAGIGSMASSLQLAARRYSRLEHRRNLLVGLVVFGLAVLGLAASPGLGLALVCQVLAGFGMVRYLATTNTLLQLVVEDRYRGRMMGLHTVMFLGTQPLGSLVLGALAERWGAPRAVVVSGCVCLLAAAWLGYRLRRVAIREQAARAA
jgi:MFS family permease